MRIRLLVFMNDSAKKADNHVYERIIDWDNSIVFPFESTFKTMKCLYGNDCVVTLEMH